MAGWQSGEIEHLARHAGLAQGIAQVVAALPLDAARRQLFVPLQLLESHGSAIEEVFAGRQTPKLRAALDQLIGEAAGHRDDRALRCSRTAPPEVRPVFLPLALVGRELMRMSRADRDPFLPRPASRLERSGRCGGRRGRGCSGPDRTKQSIGCHAGLNACASPRKDKDGA